MDARAYDTMRKDATKLSGRKRDRALLKITQRERARLCEMRAEMRYRPAIHAAVVAEIARMDARIAVLKEAGCK